MLTSRLKTTLIGVSLVGLLGAMAPTSAPADPLAEPAVVQKKGKNKGKASAKHPASSLKFRLIGPAYPSGRISDFAFHPDGSHHYYVATASGGIWETQDNGTTWKPIFDRYGSYAVGVIEMDPSNPLTLWAGTGENNSQRSVAAGDGVYVSHNGGKSWKNMGLKNSGHISQIWIHPDNSDVVVVAAQGPLWSNGGDRGLYRTTDGGKTWTRVLEIDEYTGVNEFVVDPKNPDEIVVSTYQRRRHVWTLINGGPGSGIHRSSDGGASWSKVTSGLPVGDNMGRIGLSMAPSSPNMIYAIIEANAAGRGVYRSTDFGRTWSKRSSHITTSPQYYNELVVDPNDPETVYSLDTRTSVSRDGGRSFRTLGNTHRHVDDHALWVDPDNSKHLMIGGDGGVYESWNGGTVWRHAENLPIVQFYRVQPDNAYPFYNVCGGTQDNNSLCGPSRTTRVHGITNADWHTILGGDGYEPQIDPEDPNIVYTQYQYGGLARYDRRTQQRTWIAPLAEPDEPRYKFNWNTPLLISPHNRNRIYYAAEYLFVSDDRGDSWTKIDYNLTRQIDRNALEVMDRVWSDNAVAKNASTSIYGSAIGISESELQKDLIYVGTDDGLIHVTKDGGATWGKTESVKGVPEMSLIEDILASQHDVNVAYAVADNHKRGDNGSYIMKTSDQGKRWRLMKTDLPKNETVHTIVEDHKDPNLLFVGTELGVYVTTNGGANWTRMRSGLPTVAIRDLEIQERENDLVVGTFGRGIYVLDDYSALRTDAADLKKEEVTLFSMKDALLYAPGDLWGGAPNQHHGHQWWRAQNPQYGAVFSYHVRDGYTTLAKKRRKAELAKEKKGEDTPYPSWDELRREDNEEAPALIFTVKDSDGTVIQRIKGRTSKGFHRQAWNLRHVQAGRAREGNTNPGTGYFVKPGTYTISAAKRINGELVDLGVSQSVVVKLYTQDSPEIATGAAREEMHAFRMKSARLLDAVDGASAKMGDMQKHLRFIEAALFKATAATEEHQQKVRSLREKLRAINVALNGDSTITRRQEADKISVRGRASRLSFWVVNDQAPVGGQQKETYQIASTQFAKVLADIKKVAVELKAFEDSLNDIGASYTPGRVVDWKPE